MDAILNSDWKEDQGVCPFCKNHGDVITPQRPLNEQRWLEMRLKIIESFYEEYVDGAIHTLGRFYYTDDYLDFLGGLPKKLDKERSIEVAKNRRALTL